MRALIPETLVVVGAGICGLQVALMARLAGFHRVVILESTAFPYAGASLFADKLQTGGQYPLSLRTAIDCLHGAMMFRQMMPESVYVCAPPQLLVVTEESERDPRCASFAAVVANYRVLRQAYERALRRYGEATGVVRKVACRAFFGEPGRLGVEVDAERLIGGELGPHVGALVGGERALNQPLLGTFLLECAKRFGVEIVIGARVTRVERRARGFRAHTANSRWWDCEQLVAAAWLGTWNFLDPGFAAHGELRCVVVMETGALRCSGGNRPVMAMQGPSGASYGPFDDRQALLFSARPGASRVRLLTRSDFARTSEPIWPLKAGDLAQDHNVQAILQHALQGPLRFLDGARPRAAFKVPVIRGASPDERRYWRPRRTKEGVIVSIPTKATYSTRTALDTLRLLLRDALSRRTITARHVRDVCPQASPLVVPEALRLRDVPAPLPHAVQHFARERGLAA